MVMINGKLVPANTVSLNMGGCSTAQGGISGMVQQASNAGRNALFAQLRDKVMQKTSKNIDIAQIESTFKTQDL